MVCEGIVVDVVIEHAFHHSFSLFAREFCAIWRFCDIRFSTRFHSTKRFARTDNDDCNITTT